MDHELNPGSCKQVERLGGFERVSREDPVTDVSWARLAKRISSPNFFQGKVTTEPGATGSHTGALKIVIAAILSTKTQIIWTKL
jgi:hypothetical protein